jgi:hypothetical protein
VPIGYARGVLGVAVLSALPVSVSLAQSVPVLGYVAAKNANPERLEVFKRGLTELGYIEGKNIRIDYREAVLDGEYNSAMAELVDLRVRIILAANVAAAVEAAKATASIPIVMLAVNYPVGLGLVKSLEHPGTSVTGTTMYAPLLIGERLRILKRLVPNLDKVSMVLNGNNANNAAQSLTNVACRPRSAVRENALANLPNRFRLSCKSNRCSDLRSCFSSLGPQLRADIVIRRIGEQVNAPSSDSAQRNTPRSVLHIRAATARRAIPVQNAA